MHGAGIHLDGSTIHDAAGAISSHVGHALSGMDITSLLALAAALGWASGLRLYAVVFITGLIGWMDWIALPGALGILESPIVLFFSGIMLFAEFFADKIPGFDSIWDLLQSVIRVPAGAALAASVFGADNAQMALVAALMGGTLAATSQAAKTTTRAAINASPEPFSNVGASLAEDGLSIGAIWLALTNPVVFVVVLAIAVVAMWIVTWLMFKFLRATWRKLRRLFGTNAAHPASGPP
ncbi:membrane protein [Lampropedia cohaerens]|uniref:Membrane protein n=1 Tax=Lampropedia cohaerens TaxID=1610491 RepID=A0A0U1PZ86_9BURK|nr:membrane protein [Lampropedia cohaerens]